MKKLFFVLFVFLTVANISVAQPGQLVVREGDKGLHLEHTVTAKEGFFSVGRLYNVHPKFLAEYNSLDINKGLNIGQVIHIPLTDTNFTQRRKTANPVYYTVGEKEGLLKVSNSNKKVKLQSLREWNKLKNDTIHTGSKLIVGFLLNAQISAVATANPVKEETKKVAENKPAEKMDVVTNKPVVKEEVKKPAEQEKPIVKEEAKKTQPDLTKQEVTMNMAGQGYFKSYFDQQVKQSPVAKTETVTSGIFNTINGLQDAKYYLLINGITPGTIVRVINPDNNKTIYAKVLGEMNGYRQNQGLDIRISNLAAATLGINEMDKFIVKINY